MDQANESLRVELTEAQAAQRRAEDELEPLKSKVSQLESDMKVAVAAQARAEEALQEEQLKVAELTADSDRLRQESTILDNEGLRLRQDYDDKVLKLHRAEEALVNLASQYGDLVDQLAYVTSDYQVRSSPTMCRTREGTTETLSSYLTQLYEQHKGARSSPTRNRLPVSPGPRPPLEVPIGPFCPPGLPPPPFF